VCRVRRVTGNKQARIERGEPVELPPGPALALMQGVKALFDPHGILNPGKMS
jgi:FAD/FMN-containing dehydrogenase